MTAGSSSPYRFACTPGGDETNPTILFLHGFLGNKDDWRDIARSFHDRYRTLAVDLPGHGETVVADDALYRMENCASGIVQWLDDMRVTDCSVVGYSMGGRLAMYLAVVFPDRFRAFVLESTSPGLRTAEERQARVAHDNRLADEIEQTDFGEFLDNWYRQPLFASLASDPSALNRMIEHRLANDPAGLARSLKYMGTGTQPSLWERLGEITAPMLLLTGEHDAKFTGIAQQMTRLCSGVETRIISRCGHNIHVKRPQAFVRETRLFLDKNM